MADEIEFTAVRPEDLATLAPGTTAVEAHGLDDVALANLVALHALVRLDVSDCPEMTDVGLASVAALGKLEWLNVGAGPKITDEGIRALRGSKTLTFLGLGGCPGITDAAIAAACGIETLEELMPCGCQQLGDASLMAIGGAPRLRDVFISGAGFTDDGMARLAECESLVTLGMDGPVGDAGYAHLSGHPALRELHLPSCKLVTPEVLVSFAEIPELRELHFYSTPHIDDDWLSALARMDRLTMLGLMGCGVSEGGLARLRAGMKGCEIVAG